MATNNLKIGIILGSTREGRVSPQVGQWVLDKSKEVENADFEIVDIKTFNLPLLGTTEDQSAVVKWNEKLQTLDGFIFVVSEYNHSMSGALKNALDSARDAWHHKAAGIFSYGSAGGARAAEHLRGVLGELMVADVRTQILMSLFNDFDNYVTFKPQPLHEENLKLVFEQVINWSQALKPLRS